MYHAKEGNEQEGSFYNEQKTTLLLCVMVKVMLSEGTYRLYLQLTNIFLRCNFFFLGPYIHDPA